MTPTWTILLLLAILTALNSVALIGLIRQVGLLHIRIQPVPALDTEEGPHEGDELETASQIMEVITVPQNIERILLGFISPTCGLCKPLLPAFQSVAAMQGDDVATVLVADVEPERAGDYLRGHGIRLPYFAAPSVFKDSNVPGAPFVIVVDGSGIVLSAGGVNSLEQIELLLDLARSNTEIPTPEEPNWEEEISGSVASPASRGQEEVRHVY